ncbi:MAG: 4-(cytidine 5'-diphospho)-2-C-methyl-D-erythritol kinase [Candidatus Anoxymicrobium japonicum]|uniref:4-diphosphocytidyl-2-C-methyl-D-erythritol kinase n=1 Tax=Candidatus Anoxymicrobium japonicum TaxID=2013648 RepID=A0A2N3G5K4_9ACTN|nr:MAG: 4-(cytidine 5'-diphospho)-2-C-methyl-D-erythritol kinase [Candidatus Anoxymicrobium japonicum]
MLGAKTVARAKINLFLQVKERRDDGYHNIKSIMQTLELSDELYFRRTDGASDKVVIRCNDAGVPPTGDNLVSRAIDAFEEHTRVMGVDGVDVTINKRIPVGAGLGGGSADAAAALLAMNHIYELDMPMKTLMDISARIGSDVPFCLSGGTALATGRGELIQQLDSLPPLQVILASTGDEVSTGEVYKRFDALVEQGRIGPSDELDEPLDALLRGIEKHEFDVIYPALRNNLESATIATDKVEEFKDSAIRAGAVTAMMTGSGSTVFALVTGMEQAAQVAWELEKAAPVTIITSFAGKGAEIVA